MEFKSFSSGQCPDNPRYNESLSWLFTQLPLFSRVGGAAYKPGLDNTLALDAYYGSPHRKFKSIHVAGTNGKGSTSHMLAAILQSSGYKTALYTSPHLVDFRERIRINGKMIPHERVVQFVDRWKESGSDLRPSFFELTMMMAFDWFAAEKVDYAVIEVGMGGRLDSTNVIEPVTCIITNISKDHTQFLGETLPEIAREKAGIIKPGIPVVIGEAEGDVRNVFEEKAREVGAPVVFAEDDPYLLETRTESIGFNCCIARNPAGDASDELTEFSFYTPLVGEYQKKNINTVLHAVSSLNKNGLRIDAGMITEGMENVDKLTGFTGRWTILKEAPVVIADTGHNEAGLTYNFERLSQMMKERRGAKLHMVFGMVADKDIDHILALLPQNADYYFTQASIPRALPHDRMAAKAAEHGLVFPSYPIVKEAYAAALSKAGADDIVYVGGSTFVVADLLAAIG